MTPRRLLPLSLIILLTAPLAARARCTLTTCAAQGKNCGTIPNGCRGTLTCGACTAPQTCGGGGIANVCGLGTPPPACTPTTCAAQGKNCGTIPDGCGGTLTCGACTAPQTCGSGGIANVCGLGTPPPAPSPLCTATNVSGNPYSGTLCGGAFIDNCTPGALYSCTGGARGTTNNCTLAQTCSTGCLTGVNDTPVTANIGFATPVANDVCFADTAPLTFSTNATIGGSYVTMTATLTQPHTLSAFVNFGGATADVPPICGNLVPLTLASGSTSLSWVQPTGVVTTPTTVPLHCSSATSKRLAEGSAISSRSRHH